MASALILSGAQSKVVFWALVCTVLFVGTSQQDSSDDVATTIAPAARTEAPTASNSTVKTTHDDYQATVSSVATVTSTALVANSSQSITAETTTFKTAEPALSTEQNVESPNATMAGEHENSTTQEMERNNTDTAMHFEAQPADENMTTTTNLIVPPEVTHLSTVALPDMSSKPLMPKDIMQVVVTCESNAQNNVENPKCLQFQEPITCEEFKSTKMDLAQMLCNSSQHRSSSGECNIHLSASDTDPRCLLLNTDISGYSMELSESTKAALQQHGVVLTTSQSSKPRTTLIALVTTALVVTALILCGYFLSNRQSWSPGSRRLDEDYAGNDSPDNTLISVATRDQSGQGDKSNLKGGTQENGTGQAVTPTATNGHSNKQHIVADTEL